MALAAVGGHLLTVGWQFLIWPLAAVLVGIVFQPRRHRRTWDSGAAAICWVVICALQADVPPVRRPLVAWPWPWVVLDALLVLLMYGAGRGWSALHLAANRLISRYAGPPVIIAGSALLLGTAATLFVLAVAPAHSSFTVALPSGWHQLSDEPSLATDPALGTDPAVVGEHFTATPSNVWTQSEMVYDVLRVPTIGVSVVHGSGSSRFDPTACLDALNDPNGISSRLYWGTTLVSERDVDLPAGRAHAVVRSSTAGDAATIYGFSFARERRAGMIVEQLCYVVAITLPAGSGLTEADARSMVDSLRFR